MASGVQKPAYGHNPCLHPPANQKFCFSGMYIDFCGAKAKQEREKLNLASNDSNANVLLCVVYNLCLYNK